MNRDRQGAVCAVLLFGLNAFVCSRLWSAEYIDQMGSVEGSFIAISRFVMSHWRDLRWFPAWFDGMPFLRVYQPGLHVTVAGVAALFHLSPQHSYHLLAAFFYSLGPVTLFWLCDRLTGRRPYALALGLAYSLFSPCVLLSSALRHDMGGWFFARRYQVLVNYGEGPHIAALALLPLVIWSLDRALSPSKQIFIPMTAALMGALVATNWTGTVGLVMALVAYFMSRVGVLHIAAWLKAAGIGILAYLLVCPWLPPSVVATVPGNAQATDATYFRGLHFIAALAIAAALVLLHTVFERLHADRNLRFFLYFFFCSAAVVLGKLWGDVSLLPQPHRFQLEMEMSLLGAAFWPAGKRTAIVVAGLCLIQIGVYHSFANALTRPVDIATTIEYRMAKWFEEHMGNQRVFAPGNVAIWMNQFVDTPQMIGCCGQSVPSIEQSIALYTIYSDDGAGARAAELSRIWLRAYGASAIGVIDKWFANPRKFDGVLPVLWREGDHAVYSIPQRSASLAHVILPEQEVTRPPVTGLDVEPLRPFVAALDDPSLPQADMRWVNSHQIHIASQMTASQRVSLQVSYMYGWHASANGVPAPIHADALGLMLIDPHCSGSCSIDLTYDGGAEATWTRIAQGIGLLLSIFAVFLRH